MFVYNHCDFDKTLFRMYKRKRKKKRNKFLFFNPEVKRSKVQSENFQNDQSFFQQVLRL